MRVAAISAALLAAWPACASDGRDPPAASELIELHPAGGALRATIAPSRGGELSSLRFHWRGRWVELLYRGGDFGRTADFEGRAPILWPATGRNLTTAGTPGWTWRGTNYPLRIHGFARDSVWRTLGVRTRGRIAETRLELRDSAETRAVYPFGFRMRVTYRLSGSTLDIVHRVTASGRNGEAMPFSIGNHVTFKAGLTPEADGRATRLSTPARRILLLDKDNAPSGEARDIPGMTEVPLASFEKRTPVSLTAFPPRDISVRLVNSSEVTLTISHRPDRLPAGSPVLFNLWGDMDKGFFSPEPWVGKQNSLERQDGVLLLAPGKSFNWTIRIRLSTS